MLIKGAGKVSEFQSLPLYKKTERLNLTADKLKSISEQLDLQKKAKDNFNNRKLHGNYMFNVHSNHFTDEFHNK